MVTYRHSFCHAVLAAVLPAALVAVLAITPAAAKDTGLIFVSNEKSNNLIVIDPKTHKVIREIKTSRRPRDMHFSVDRTKLYVACGDVDVIDVIVVAKLEVISRIPTGPSPETFVVDEQRRRIYVANEEGSTLSIIDMDQAIIVHEVPTGAEPEGVLLSEDGKIVYVTSEVGDIVHMVDAEGGHVLQDVVVGTRPRRFAATPDRKELWVTAELSGEVYIIDRQKFEVSGKIEFLPPGMRKSDVTPVGLVMTKDGKTAFVTLGHAAHVAVVDVATRKIAAYILVDVNRGHLLKFSEKLGLPQAVANDGIDQALSAANDFEALAISLGAQKAGTRNWAKNFKTIAKELAPTMVPIGAKEPSKRAPRSK